MNEAIDTIFQVIGMVCTAGFVGGFILIAIGAFDFMLIAGSGGGLDALDDDE